MLHKVKDLSGDRIAARDGEIGRLDQVYFDDQEWRVRYFVVDTGGWLSSRKVLISPLSIEREKSSGEAIAVALSREQVERSPDVDTDKPVARQYEEAYARHYGYSLYWAPPEATGMTTRQRAREEDRRLKETAREASQSHLRSSGEVIGYAIHAADGAVGHIEDMLVDDRDWTIADLVVDTRDWRPGEKVHVPPSAIENIDWESKEVRLRMRREELARAPAA